MTAAKRAGRCMAASLGGDAPAYCRPAPPPYLRRPLLHGRAHPKWPKSSKGPISVKTGPDGGHPAEAGRVARPSPIRPARLMRARRPEHVGITPRAAPPHVAVQHCASVWNRKLKISSRSARRAMLLRCNMRGESARGGARARLARPRHDKEPRRAATPPRGGSTKDDRVRPVAALAGTGFLGSSQAVHERGPIRLANSVDAPTVAKPRPEGWPGLSTAVRMSPWTSGA